MRPPSLRVLVADDEPLTRWAVAQALQPTGNLVTEADSPAGARDQLVCGRFDVVVMACPLGGADVTDVLDELRCRQPPARLVLLCDDETGSALRERFPDAYVVERPFSLDALLDAVHERAEGGARMHSGGRS